MQIEKNVPFSKSGAGAPAKYPFGEMEVGDSVLFDVPATFNAVRCAATQYGRRYKRKFAARMVEGGLRVWRIE